MYYIIKVYYLANRKQNELNFYIMEKVTSSTAEQIPSGYNANKAQLKERFMQSIKAKEYILSCIREDVKIDESKLNGIKIVRPL